MNYNEHTSSGKEKKADNENTNLNTFIEYEIYKNLIIYCKKYIKHDIQSVVLDKFVFIRNLHFDNNIKLETRKDGVDWSIYIIIADTKLLANILTKDLNNVVIIYPTIAKKNIYRTINKHNRTNVLSYSYDVFKIILPEMPGAPKYKILSAEETEFVCKCFRRSKYSFNKLLSTDPMAIWYGIKSDNLIEIEVVSEITSVRIDYKYCL